MDCVQLHVDRYSVVQNNSTPTLLLNLALHVFAILNKYVILYTENYIVVCQNGFLLPGCICASHFFQHLLCPQSGCTCLVPKYIPTSSFMARAMFAIICTTHSLLSHSHSPFTSQDVRLRSPHSLINIQGRGCVPGVNSWVKGAQTLEQGWFWPFQNVSSENCTFAGPVYRTRQLGGTLIVAAWHVVRLWFFCLQRPCFLCV